MSSNFLEAGDDEVKLAHLMNMKPDEIFGLVQETIYDDFTLEYQKLAVDYTGLTLANTAILDNLGMTRLTIRDRFTRVEPHQLIVMHREDKLNAIKGYWEDYIYANQVQWVRQPGFYYPGIVAWCQPDPDPAILFRPTRAAMDIDQCENHNSCLRFIQHYANQIGEGRPLIKYPNPMDYQIIIEAGKQCL